MLVKQHVQWIFLTCKLCSPTCSSLFVTLSWVARSCYFGMIWVQEWTVSDRPNLAFKVDLFFQSFRLRWWWKSEKSGFAEDLTENFQFLVSWQNAKSLRKMAPIFCFSLIHGEFSLTWWGKAPRSLESKSLYLCSTFQALFLQGKKITMISVFKNLIVSPIAASFLGFAVRSLPSPLRAFPLQTFLICNLVPLICNL